MLLSGASMSKRQSRSFTIDKERADSCIAVVFSICDLADLADSYSDIYEKGKVKIISNLKETWGTPAESYEAISFINCYDLVKDCTSTYESPKKWKAMVDEAISDITTYLADLSNEFLPGDIQIDIAAYEPLEGLGLSLCYALQHTILQESALGRFEMFAKKAKEYYEHTFDYLEEGSGGWTLSVDYVAHLELMAIYTPTDEQKEEMRKKAEEEANNKIEELRREEAERERERVEERRRQWEKEKSMRHLVVAGFAVLGLAIVIAATIACPPVGGAALAVGGSTLSAVAVGNTMMLAAGASGAVIHIGELVYEKFDEDLVPQIKEHLIGAFMDAVLCLKWEQVIMFIGRTGELAFTGSKLFQIEVGGAKEVAMASRANNLAKAEQFPQEVNRIVSHNPGRYSKLGVTSESLQEGFSTGKITSENASQYGLSQKNYNYLNSYYNSSSQAAAQAAEADNAIKYYEGVERAQNALSSTAKGAQAFEDVYGNASNIKTTGDGFNDLFSDGK